MDYSGWLFHEFFRCGIIRDGDLEMFLDLRMPLACGNWRQLQVDHPPAA